MKIFDLHISIFLMLYLIILLFTYFLYRKDNNKRYTFLFYSSVLFYILAIIKLTILPITIYSGEMLADIFEDYSEYVKLSRYIQVIPFHTIINSFAEGTWIGQVAGNIILFIPAGCFLKTVQIEKCFSDFKMYLCGFLISIGIELAQLITNIIVKIPSRVVDIDDIILNMAGLSIGIIFLNLVLKNKAMIVLFNRTIFQKNDNE